MNDKGQETPLPEEIKTALFCGAEHFDAAAFLKRAARKEIVFYGMFSRGLPLQPELTDDRLSGVLRETTEEIECP